MPYVHKANLGDWGSGVQISPLRPTKSITQLTLSAVEFRFGVPVGFPREPAYGGHRRLSYDTYRGSEPLTSIVERTFEIDDPSQLSGLLERPPDGEEVPEIEYAYDTTPPGGRANGHAPHLKCVFPHTARHWRGSIVRWKMVTALASDLIAARTTSASTSRWSWIASTRIALGNRIFCAHCAAGFATRGGFRVAVAHPHPSRAGLRRIASGLSCGLP